VDGQLVQGDAKIDGAWKTILAGGLGAGGKGLFALDVTNPNLSTETANTGNDAKILWERTGSSLGYIHGRPRVVLLPDGIWYVVSGNGYDSDDGIAKLVLAPLNSDAATLINTGVGSNNGLSAPALVDTDHDGDVDYAYAGDLLGNLWKFDLAASTATKLFAAGDSQPITAAPEVTNHPYGGRLIYFGTGSLLSIDDKTNIDPQTIYAIWDKSGGSYPADTSTLLQQTLTAAAHAGGSDVRVAPGTAVNWSTQYGWKVNLPAEGERLLGNPQMRDGRLVFVTHAPDRSSWLMGLDWLSGGDPDEIQFDLDLDNTLDADDMVTVDSNDRIPVGRKLGTANYSQPSIALITSGSDILYINGFLLPIFPSDTCIGDCTGGLEGGHIDVDSDAELGGATDAHKHEYDDSFDITYIDYFDLLNGNPFDDVLGDWDLQFVPILANADLSPGGVLTIGGKEWNVVDYQEMVQQKLQNWNGTDPLVDDEGDSLVHTINNLKDAGETIRISFDDQSIVSGGLMPSQTGCVKSDPNITNGRWRNGALTIHMLRLDEIKNGGAAGNAWVAQNPTDLREGMVGGGLHGNLDNDAGFLFESTLFWHFKSPLAKLLGYEEKPCYGDDDYEQIWEIERTGMSEAILNSLFPGDGEQILALAAQLRTLTCDAGFGEDCQDTAEYKEIDDELADLIGDDYEKKIKPYLIRGNERVGTEGSGDGTSTEADITDKTEDLSPVPGPSFNWGRHSWIDL